MGLVAAVAQTDIAHSYTLVGAGDVGIAGGGDRSRPAPEVPARVPAMAERPLAPLLRCAVSPDPRPYGRLRINLLADVWLGGSRLRWPA
jgi:hypothetical protein